MHLSEEHSPGHASHGRPGLSLTLASHTRAPDADTYIPAKPPRQTGQGGPGRSRARYRPLSVGVVLLCDLRLATCEHRCLLLVACCLSLVACRLLLVACCLSLVACCLSLVACCLLLVACCLSLVTGHLSQQREQRLALKLVSCRLLLLTWCLTSRQATRPVTSGHAVAWRGVAPPKARCTTVPGSGR